MELTDRALILLLFCFLALGSKSQAALNCNKTSHVKIGCYKRGNYLGNLLINDRDPSSIKNQGHLINWDKIEESLHSLVCRCSAEVKKYNYRYFGIRFFAECWAGNHIPLDESQRVKTCFQGQNISTCNDNSTLECAGRNEENYIYKLKPDKVDGGFSNWTQWGTCNASCGAGVQTRQRTCDNPAPKNGGAPCKGNTVEHRSCFIKHCPVNGGFSAWTNWGNCSTHCGKGTQFRTRKCDNPLPNYGGLPCNGHTKENRTCNIKPCPGSRIYLRRVCEDRKLFIKCPIGKRISVKKALYGRKTRKYCNIPRCHTRNIKCESNNSYYEVSRRCEKKRKCFVAAQNWVFGEPCRHTSKYLEIRFVCV